MAFWNRKHGLEFDKKRRPAVTPAERAIVSLHEAAARLEVEIAALRDEVAELRACVHQPVPTNGGPRAGSAVQDWLPVVDRLQELLLVQMGNADLAQAFGTHARQREALAAEKPDVAWTEPDESTYENL